MRRKLPELLTYLIFWLIFFLLARIFFLLTQFRETASYSISVILNTFIHGFRLDLSTTAYILIIPLIVSVLSVYISGKWYRIFIRIYSYFLILFFTGLIMGDAITYGYWGFRLEFSVLAYLKNPGDAMASASVIQMLVYIIAYLALSALVIFSFNRLTGKYLNTEFRPARPHLAATILTVILGLMIIPIRGGTGRKNINVASVYFTDSLFPNHAAVNLIWNIGHTAIYSKPVRNPYVFSNPESAGNDFKNLLSEKSPARMVLNTKKPNILIIILESFGSSLTERSAPDSVVTPRFRQYIPEGLYFTEMYAAGSRTDKAIPSIFSGYPNLPLIQVIRESARTASMPGIIKMLDSSGYYSTFWYGGDINFANLNTYLTQTGFRNKITRQNFSQKECKSTWGAHDDILFRHLLDSVPYFPQPFVCSVLSLSSHEPFDVPMKAVFKGQDLLSKFKNSVYYTDRCLGEFLDGARKTNWWKNTLVVILADHGRRNTEKVPVYSQEIYKIPMLWLGGALAVKNEKITRVGNQFDLPMTLASQLDLKGNFKFSKDLLTTGSPSFAIYTFNEGFGFITDSSAAVYDVKMRKNVFESGKDPDWASRMGKSFLQVLFDDYLSR